MEKSFKNIFFKKHMQSSKDLDKDLFLFFYIYLNSSFENIIEYVIFCMKIISNVFLDGGKKIPSCHWPCMGSSAEVHGYWSEQMYVMFVQPSLPAVHFKELTYCWPDPSSNNIVLQGPLSSRKNECSNIFMRTENSHPSINRSKNETQSYLNK